MGLGDRYKVDLGNLGSVTLTDAMGLDRKPAMRARHSLNNKEEKTFEDDMKLNKYLLKNRHTTPFEFCQIEFFMEMPIFVARQWVRHRMASIEEISLRYVKAEKEFYIPDVNRMLRQSESNKQGSSNELINDPLLAAEIMNLTCLYSFEQYERLIEMGLAKETARIILPLNTRTSWYWTSDLHNLLHLLGLRHHGHAQWEIQQFAQAVYQCTQQIFPEILKIWEELERPGSPK